MPTLLRHTKRAVCVSAFGLVCLPATATAADWHDVRSDVRFAGPAAEASAAFLRSHAASLSLSTVKLTPTRTLRSGSHDTVRFAQHHGALPVIGTGAAVRISSHGEVRAAVVEVERNLSVSSTPQSTPAAALASVQAWLGEPVSVASNQPAVLRDRARGGRVVWLVDVHNPRGGTRYYVDDVSLAIVARRALASTTMGRVYPISLAVTPSVEDVELLDLVVTDPQKLTGWNGQLSVTNYVSGGPQGGPIDVVQEVVSNAGTDFLYDPPLDPLDPDDAFAQVNVYYHLTRARDFFNATHGIDFQQSGWDLNAIANMHDNGAPYDNAFFSPIGQGGEFAANNLIAIGQGTSIDFAYDSDVIIHEFGHYVGHNAIAYSQGPDAFDEYGLSLWGASIDEGVADYFAGTINGDPILGEAATPGGIRNMSITDKTCPTDIIGDVHLDGEIVGSLGWSLRERFSAIVADPLVWGATTLLTPNPSLADFARGLIQTAQDLESEGTLTAADVAEIEQMVAARGLTTCEKVLELTAGTAHTSPLSGLNVIAEDAGAPTCAELKSFGMSLHSLFHYRHEPVEGGEALRFAVDMSALGGGELDWTIHARKGEHVVFQPAEFGPAVDEYDHAARHSGTSGELIIDASSTPPFDPTASYYAVIVHQNCPTALASISADVLETDSGGGASGGAAGGGIGGLSEAGGGAGDAGFTAAGGGCSCRAARPRPTRLPALLAFAGLLCASYLRRRPRASLRAFRRCR